MSFSGETSTLLNSGQDTTGAGDQGTTDAVAPTISEAAPTPATTEAPAAEPAKTEEVAAEAEKPAPKAPEKYEFTLPDGVDLDAASTEKFTAIARELDLSQEQAQQLVSLEAERVQAQAEAHARTVAEWRTAVETDKVLGGDRLKESVGVARAVLDKFGSPEISKILDTTGLGNHPALFTMLHRIGKAMAQDRFVVGGETGAVNTDLASRLYPNQT